MNSVERACYLANEVFDEALPELDNLSISMRNIAALPNPNLPDFHGNSNECPVKHISLFAKVCRPNSLSTIDILMRKFPVTLEDYLWYNLNIELYPSLTSEEIGCISQN
ncbi:hypothetical protein CFP56_005975 [Quercus suber]|uniref:SOCS box domain-containing protein n=1 Tax=Quercus suber TaxID=58331 RepID=A0AAW0M9V0_QUESU